MITTETPLHLRRLRELKDHLLHTRGDPRLVCHLLYGGVWDYSGLVGLLEDQIGLVRCGRCAQWVMRYELSEGYPTWCWICAPDSHAGA